MAVNVRIEIGTVVLEGMQPKDAALFQQALTRELQRGAESHEDLAGIKARTGNAPLCVRSGSRPEDTAARVSRAILGGEDR